MGYTEKMEFRDLRTQYLKNQKDIDGAIQKVLVSSCFIGGEPVKELEEKLADYVGVRHCITCANGTDALQLALMAWGIGKRDAVFVPDFTFFSTAEVVPWVGAVPVFVDVDKNTFNISAEALEETIQRVIKEGKLVPRAIIAVDLFGQPADYSRIKKITSKYNMLLLEDGAQGFGGRIGNQKACSFGDIATTSFFPAKPLGCYGDGGAVFTDNDEWAELVRSYKVHGKGTDKYDNIRIGLNSRLDTLQAEILQVKLKLFQEQELEAVNHVADWYNEKLKEVDVICPKVLNGCYSSWAQYTIRLSKEGIRDKLQSYLKEYNIPSMIYYAKPMHKQKAFEKNEHVILVDDYIYKNSVDLCKEVLSLPMHPYMEEKDVNCVAEVIDNGLNKLL